MTKEEIAKHIFARNSKVNTLHLTSDGQAFYEKHQAEGHASRLKDSKVETVERAASKKVADKVDPSPFPFLQENVKKASEAIQAVNTLEELEAILEAEKAGDDRKGVAEAIEARKTELTEPKKPE